ncbi:response regulator transcription factor [Allosphingosinicella deserti]|nr:response regulator transcription factor [Sphingomonas deserti]
MEILVVEDDPKLRSVLSATAQVGGFDTREAESGSQAISLVSQGVGDVVLLDLGLPDYDGRELLIILRQLSDRPILVVSGRGSEQDRIEALDLGADDFIVKPFLPGELLARIRASLRRHGRPLPEAGDAAEGGFDAAGRLPSRLGSYLLDPFDQSVSFNGGKARLSDAEYRIFGALAGAAEAVLSRAELLAILYGEEAPATSKIIDVYISRVRAKLRDIPGGRDVLQTVTGSGWRLLEPPRTVSGIR